MRQTLWRVAATVATGVVAVGVLVAVAGGAAGDHAPGDVLQTVGFVLWALMLLAWMVQPATDADRLEASTGRVREQPHLSALGRSIP